MVWPSGEIAKPGDAQPASRTPSGIFNTLRTCGIASSRPVGERPAPSHQPATAARGELGRLQAGYGVSLAKSRKERDQALIVLMKNYLNGLNNLKKQLTIADRIDEAVAVAKEMKNVQRSLDVRTVNLPKKPVPPKPAAKPVTPVTPAVPGSTREGLFAFYSFDKDEDNGRIVKDLSGKGRDLIANEE